MLAKGGVRKWSKEGEVRQGVDGWMQGGCRVDAGWMQGGCRVPAEFQQSSSRVPAGWSIGVEYRVE